MKLPNSKMLFLIDLLGALFSAIAYGFVLTEYQEIFGFPRETLIVLSFLAFVYFIYSASCFWVNPKIWRSYLSIIAIANLLHCCLTSYFIILFFQQMNYLGVLYFVMEIIIVGALAIIELRVAFSQEILKNND